MKKTLLIPYWLSVSLFALTLFSTSTQAVDQPLGFVGKDEWLFYQVEYSDPADQAATNTTIDLIRRFNKVLSRNGIAMAFTMVPIKVRIYAEHLPDSAKINPYMESNYDHMTQLLRSGQVNVIDLNRPFLNHPDRNGEFPFYFKLDTHMSPSGTMLTAEIIRKAIDDNTVLKTVLEAIPEEQFTITWGKHKVNSLARGLIGLLPEPSAKFADEQILPFLVFKKQQTAGSLLGDGTDAAITLMGSSYSAPWYRLPDALRYTLQRDLLTVSVEATHGSWEGMESYLRDNAFQTRKPKLIIWEMPERDMRMPPNYKYRDVRYHSDNTEWLLRAAAWVENSCKPAPVIAKIVANGLIPNPTDDISLGKITEKDYLDLSFNKPLEKLDYLVAKVTTSGSNKIILEATGANTESRWFNIYVPGDGTEYLLKTPLPAHGKGFTKLRIFPGKSNSFSIKGLQVCKQSEDILQ
jgi:alginate O-acetyltransferase complex protein AlgJ